MPTTYGRFYSDSRHSGFVDLPCDARGVLTLETPLAEKGTLPVEARLLLCPGDELVVDGMSTVLALDGAGRRLWRRDKTYGGQVVVREGRVYFSAPSKDRFIAVDLAGKVKFEGMPIPGIIERSFVVLFEPGEEGLIAQIQDPGAIQDTPANFLVYSMKYTGLGFEWSALFDHDTSPVAPLVSWEHKRLVTTTHDSALVYALKNATGEPDPVGRFPLPLGNAVRWLSCTRDGLLAWCGYADHALRLALTDMEGKTVWEWASDFQTVEGGTPIAPPIDGQDLVLLLTAGGLTAVRGGDQCWSVPAEVSRLRHATAFKDGTIVCTSTRGLRAFDASGEKMFDVELKDPPATPPIVDGGGRLFVAGTETLFGFA